MVSHQRGATDLRKNSAAGAARGPRRPGGIVREVHSLRACILTEISAEMKFGPSLDFAKSGNYISTQGTKQVSTPKVQGIHLV